jgi:hypothetical protein
LDRRVTYDNNVVGASVGDYNTTTINVTFQDGQTRTVQIFRLLHPIDERRIQAEDWKQLHEEFQKISLKLVLVRGIVSPKNLHWVLQGLEIQWTLDCQDLIQKFIDLDRLPERVAKREFIAAHENGGWLAQLRSCSLELDGIIRQCVEPEELGSRLEEIIALLLRLERVGGQLLGYLDSRLQRVIKELDQAIYQARQILTEPPSSTQPETTS